MIWEFLDKFNAVTGAIMFFVTLGNLFISWKINARINSAIDLNRLKNDKNIVVGKINAFIRKIEIEKNVSDDDREAIILLLASFQADYPDLKKLHRQKFSNRLQSNNVDYVDIFKELKRLKVEIERMA